MSQNPATLQQEDLTELIEEIASRVIGYEWQLGFAELAEWTHCSYDFWVKQAYNMPGGDSISDLLDGFGSHNVAVLVILLEEAGYQAVRKQFFQAGLYLSADRIRDWLDLLHSISLSRLQSDPVDLDLLQDALHASTDTRNAAYYYWHSLYERNQLTHFAANLYIERHQIQNPELIQPLLNRILTQAERDLSWNREALYAELEGLFLSRARSQGLLPESDTIPANHPALDSPAVQEAYAELHCPPACSISILRRQYKHLLKQFHPDRNPAGLQKSQKIIAAYKTLKQNGLV